MKDMAGLGYLRNLKVSFLTTLILFICSSAFCANVMITDIWSFTVKKDLIKPYVTDKFPLPNAVGIPVDSKISCHIKDDETGVDINTIVMKVSNIEVTPIITGTKYDYFVEYSPGVLPWNQIINVSVNASDLAN